MKLTFLGVLYGYKWFLYETNVILSKMWFLNYANTIILEIFT